MGQETTILVSSYSLNYRLISSFSSVGRSQKRKTTEWEDAGGIEEDDRGSSRYDFKGLYLQYLLLLSLSSYDCEPEFILFHFLHLSFLYTEIGAAGQTCHSKNRADSIGQSSWCCDHRLPNGTTTSRCYSSGIWKHRRFERDSSLSRGENIRTSTQRIIIIKFKWHNNFCHFWDYRKRRRSFWSIINQFRRFRIHLWAIDTLIYNIVPILLCFVTRFEW